MFVLNLTLKACSNIAYGFNHRDYNYDDCVLKGRRMTIFSGLLLKKQLRLFKTDGECMLYLWLKPQAILHYPSGIERKLM